MRVACTDNQILNGILPLPMCASVPNSMLYLNAKRHDCPPSTVECAATADCPSFMIVSRSSRKPKSPRLGEKEPAAK